MTPLVDALIITGIGMGLVFIAILLLWGLMELMMRLTQKQALAEQAAEAEEAAEAEVEPAAVETAQPDARRRAAAAAVAAALALRPLGVSLPADLPGETLSAWQSVRRSNQLTMRTSAYSRKQRGTVR